MFLGVSVGNGVRGGITLHKIGGGSAIKVNFIALTLHYLCRRKGVRDYYHAISHRFAGAGRSNHGRGAMNIKEEGTTFCAFRNNF